ncbi:C80 family cysteine peptidase [Candidatus Regiella endosymbiont of Tuberolachnus salignus]|uniref:C80 family cysteine peptidase n=1 Tax=Candidatus Regiella endosymbiont of Tuberolachnus salignus TaxID=3077956 RepID=UPI0030CA9030
MEKKVTEPVYYMKENEREIDIFKTSPDFEVFKKQYEEAINKIIQFYNEHSPDKGREILIGEEGNSSDTVENMFTRFKQRLFTKNAVPAYLHSLYHAKRPMEEIAQSLVKTSGIALKVKLAEIQELAKKIKFCASSVHSYVLSTKLNLSHYSGDLAADLLAYTNRVTRDVIKAFTAHHSILRHSDIHTFNAYWNGFSKELRLAPITDPLAQSITLSPQKYHACHHALRQALTPYNITDQLAKNYLNNLCVILGKEPVAWGMIQNTIANSKAYYKDINVSALMEEPVEGEEKYRLRSDPLWLQVEIAKQLSFLPSESTWPNNAGGLIETVTEDAEGNKLQRLVDLFWRVTPEGNISQPDINCLGKIIDQVNPAQLMKIIAQTCDQDAPLLSQINPQRLPTANLQDIRTFFSKLGDEGSIDYITTHKAWFQNLEANLTLLIPIISRLDEAKLATISADLLGGMKAKDIDNVFKYWAASNIMPRDNLLKILYQQALKIDFNDNMPRLSRIFRQFLVLAIKTKNQPMVKTLSEQIPYNDGLLYYAVVSKDVAILKTLLEANVDPNEPSLHAHFSILQDAVLSQNPTLIEVLLAHYARDDSADALMEAIQQGNVEMVERLSKIVRCRGRFTSIYPRMLSLAENTKNSAQITALLREQQDNLMQFQFDHVMLPTELEENARVPLKPIGSSYKAILYSLNQLHHTSGMELIKNAFILKLQIQAYNDEKRRDTRRERTLLTLDQQINQALFPPAMTPYITEIIKMAQTRLPLAVELYQMVFNSAPASQSTLMHFMINAVKENAEVRLVDVKKIYHRIYQANTDNWDRNYTRDARKQLNKLLRKPADESSLPLNFNGQPKSRVKQEVEHQLAVIFEKGHQGMLLSYDSMMQYQDTIDFITKYIHELKGRGITTLCLPLSTRIKALIDRYLQGKAESTILPLNRSLRKLCVTARENDIKIIALDPPSKPQNIVQQGMADNKVLMKLTELSARLLPTEKFLAIYQQQSLLSKPLGRRFLPGIAPLLGLPALTVLSKKEYRIYFGLPQSESTEKNQLLVLNDISHRQERELSAPHLSTAKMFDASEWRKIPLKSARATLSSPLNSKIILVLENDLTAKEAGEKLFNKDPDNRALFYLSAEGDFRLVKGEASVLTSHVSILAVGHGRGGEGERNHQTLGGSKASALATRIQKFITQLQAQYVITLTPYSISLVGCSLTDYEKQTGGYARQFAESLAEQGTYADIGAYRTKVRVNESGHRLTELAEDSWHQNSADDKLVLRWNNEKKLVPANNLALRLQRARELIDELASNQKFYLSLNTQQQRDLSQVFQRPDGEMDIERMLLTTHHQDRRQTWNKNVQQLLQHPEIHTELAEVSLQSALRQRQHWHQRQQQSALAFYQTGTQAGITENRGIKIRAHLALQGLYISDSAFNNHTLTDSTALGLAWLDAYVVGEENTFFDGIKGHSEIKREKAAGIISLAEIQRADSLRQLFDDLQQVTQRNMAHQRLFTPQQKISNIGSYWLKGQYHSMMLNITANGSGYLYSLYDANVGVIHLNDSHSHENLSTLHTLLNDYLQTRDTSGKSRAQQYGMTERNNQYQVEIYRVNTDQTGEMRSTLQAFQQSLKVIGEAQHIKRSQNQTLWPSSRRRLDRINAGAHRLACGMQAMGYIIGIATIKKYTDMLNDVRLTPEQKEEIRFERNLALVSFGYNGITDPLQLVLSKVYPSIARQALARSMGQLPAFTHCAEKLGFKLKFAGVKFGGAGLNLLGTGFDIYQAYHAFSQISTVTDREVRQDLIVSGVFSTIGAIVGIVTSIAFMASATAAAAVAPLGVVIGLGLMLGRGIYSVVRQIEAIEKYITLDGYEKLANGWRVFWGMRPTADVQRRLAYERQKPIFLQHYKDYLFENARRKMMSNQDIDTYIYSLGDFDLQAHPFLNLVTIDTTPHGMLPRIGRRILKSGLRPEEVEPEKRKYHLKPDEIFEVEKTDEYYYTPGSIKAVDDTFNGAEWGDVITEKNHLIPNVGVTGDTSLSITERHITSVLGSSASTSFGYKNVALIDLGDGNDCGIGFANKNNIFLGGTGKKNYTGGQLHDIFYLGNKQKHVLPAPNLSSTFDGKGSDQDTLIIESKPPGISGYNVNLGTASIFYIGSNEPILAATLRNIEHIIAHAELNDTLVGDHHHNRLNGRGGNDILYGCQR